MTTLAGLELVPYALRFREPYVTARGRLDRRDLLLIRLVSSDGVAGLGEAAPLALRGGPGVTALARQLERCREALVGAELEPAAGIGALEPLLAACRSRGASLQALAAIELALLDLAGKLAGVPVWRLLGAGGAQPVRCNATLVADEPSAVARNALAWSARGFATFKLKLGAGDDPGQVEAVRRATGPEARIRVDANACWDLGQATSSLQAMEPFEIELAEQPVAELGQMARLAARTSIPLAADESVVDVADARRARGLGSCALATVKVAKVGGVIAALRIAAELPTYLSSALDGPLGIAAAWHLAQALPAGPAAGLAHGLATQLLFDGTIASVGPELRRDELTMPGDAGLGVELDDAALASLRL